MREDIADESVDLIYLDPPFNSKRLYNAFIGNAQWVAFDDTWRWSEAVNDFHEIASDVSMGGTMEGLQTIHGEGPELAYLSYMANRLRECYRVLKPTGSLYLHCDPTMSHSLKLVMDGIFGKRNFRNEIVWKRATSKAKGSQHWPKTWGNNTDTILFYGKGKDARVNPFRKLNFDEITVKFPKVDENGKRYKDDSAHIWSTPGMGARPNLCYTWRGFTNPHPSGWRLSKERLEEEYQNGNFVIRQDGKLERRAYESDYRGEPIGNLWADIDPAMGNERVGFPTQKPVELLKRIVKASSREGDTILDPFCGCGTTIEAAQALNRNWTGIDICVNACEIIEKRLRGSFDIHWSDIEFIGLPRTIDHARTLFNLDAFKFERWAASIVDGMEANTKQVGDKGIDGRGRLAIGKGKFIDIVSQIKGGHTNPGHVQAFDSARRQARADLGIFTCFEDRVTQGMRDTAASTGRFMDVPKVQIYTIEDYFEGRKPEMPSRFNAA